MAEKKMRVLAGNEYLNLRTGEKVTVVSNNKETGIVTFSDGTMVPKSAMEYKFHYLGNNVPQHCIKEEEMKISPDGILELHGNRIETGSYRVEKFVSSYPGAILLQIASKDGKRHDLVEYGPRKDVFKKLLNDFDSLDVKYDDHKGLYIYSVRREETHKVPSEDDPSKIEDVTGVSESLYICKDGEILMRCDTGYEYDYLFGTARYIFNEDNALVIVLESSAILKSVEDENGYDFFEVKDTGETHISEFVIETEEVEEDGEVKTYTHVNAYGFMFKDTLKNVSLVHDGHKSLFVVSDKGICYTNNDHHPRYANGNQVVDVVEQYPNLLKVDCGTIHNTFYLENDSGDERKKIHVEKTDDRGYVTEIEDIE